MNTEHIETTAPLLTVIGLSKWFGGLQAVQDLNLEVYSGEILGLIGPNGSGKSTVLNLVTGFETPTAGAITLKGKVLNGLKPHEAAQAGVVKTFQLGGLFRGMTVEEALSAACHLTVRGSSLGALLRTPEHARAEGTLQDKVSWLLSFLRLTDRRHVQANNLASGEQARLKIGMAVATEAELLLLDEPAAGMNPAESDALAALISALHEKRLTIVLVEHNMKVVMSLCTRVAVMNFGSKIGEGRPSEVARDPIVIAAYLGHRHAC